MTNHEDLQHWLRLALTEGVGSVTARELLGHFGLPEYIFSAGFPALQKRVPEKLAYALSAPISDEMQAQIDKTLAWAAQPGNAVLTLADSTYPQALLSISDPPPLLYAKGQIALLNGTALAIVGSRNATIQGMQNADHFAQILSQAGLTIVSGLGLGIDAAAHAGGMTRTGSTIAVVGTGLDIVYPARHRDLAHRIADQGCLLSEYPLGTPAIATNFPRRNRLISGLALGVLVVEAAAHSGSLITARCALDQGRDVFAIPGSIHSPLSKGCHQLIRQGAKLVESAQDILEELRLPQIVSALPAPPDNTTQGDPAIQTLLAAAGHDPVSIDQLVARTALSAAAIQAQLLTLEMQGNIELLAGGLYRRLS
jgi:DNA processing protein